MSRSKGAARRRFLAAAHESTLLLRTWFSHFRTQISNHNCQHTKQRVERRLSVQCVNVFAVLHDAVITFRYSKPRHTLYDY